MLCKKCKKEIPEWSLYCNYCGSPQKRDKKKKMYQRPDGNFEMVKRINGKPVHFYGKTEKEVLNKLISYTKEEETGPFFEKIVEYWEKNHLPKLSYNTQHGYAAAVKSLKDHFKDIPVKNITTPMIVQYLNQLSSKGYTKKTIKNYESVAGSIFRTAVLEGYIATSPTDKVPVPNGKKSKKRIPASTSDIQTVLNHHDSIIGKMMMVFLFSGLRLGEAIALKGKNVDFEGRKIIVTGSAYYISNDAIIKSPKTDAGYRTVFLAEILLDIIPSVKPEEYVFSFDPSRPIKKSEYYGALKKYKDAFGITSTPHQFRHSFASLMFEAGLSAKEAQPQLGHSSITVTEDVYTHVSAQHQKQNLIQFDQYIRNKFV